MTKPVAAILLGSSASPALLAQMSRDDEAGGPPSLASAIPSPMAALVKRLVAAGISITVVEDLEEAKAVVGLRDRPPRAASPGMDDCGVSQAAGPPAVTPILLDLSRCSSDDPEDLETARRLLGDCRHAFGGQGPIAITAGAPPRLVMECFRAGAADVIDLTHEGTTRAKAAVARACDVEQHRRAEVEVTREQRELLDELVRDLVRTERRTIDLEQRIGEAEAGGGANNGSASNGAASNGTHASNGTASNGAPAKPVRAATASGLLHDERVYLERIRSRHAQLLARYLGLKSAAQRDS